MSSRGAAAAIMARIKEGLGSEAPIAPKLHKRPRRRRAKQVYGLSIEWTGKGLGGIYSPCQKGFQGSLVMIGVSIRQFTHRKLMSVVVWCLDLYGFIQLYLVRVKNQGCTQNSLSSEKCAFVV